MLTLMQVASLSRARLYHLLVQEGEQAAGQAIFMCSEQAVRGVAVIDRLDSGNATASGAPGVKRI